jgi:hypothetical protein
VVLWDSIFLFRRQLFARVQEDMVEVAVYIRIRVSMDSLDMVVESVYMLAMLNSMDMVAGGAVAADSQLDWAVHNLLQ